MDNVAGINCRNLNSSVMLRHGKLRMLSSLRPYMRSRTKHCRLSRSFAPIRDLRLARVNTLDELQSPSLDFGDCRLAAYAVRWGEELMLDRLGVNPDVQLYSSKISS